MTNHATDLAITTEYPSIQNISDDALHHWCSGWLQEENELLIVFVDKRQIVVRSLTPSIGSFGLLLIALSFPTLGIEKNICVSQ